MSSSLHIKTNTKERARRRSEREMEKE